MRRPELWWHVIALPDQNDMDEWESCDRAKDGTHRQVISSGEGFFVDFDEDQAKTHD